MEGKICPTLKRKDGGIKVILSVTCQSRGRSDRSHQCILKKTILHDFKKLVPMEAVVLAYGLYQQSLRPGYVMDDLIRLLNNEQSMKEDVEKPEKTTDELLFQYQMPSADRTAQIGRAAQDGKLVQAGKSAPTGRSPAKSADFITKSAKPGVKTARTEGENPEISAGNRNAALDAVFNAVSKPGRRKHATFFSR